MRLILDGDEAAINVVLQYIKDSAIPVEATWAVSGYDRDSETNANIRRNICRLREERGLTRHQLSEMSGVRVTLISFVESGHRVLNDWELRCIADTLGVTVKELMT